MATILDTYFVGTSTLVITPIYLMHGSYLNTFSIAFDIDTFLGGFTTGSY